MFGIGEGGGSILQDFPIFVLYADAVRSLASHVLGVTVVASVWQLDGMCLLLFVVLMLIYSTDKKPWVGCTLV